MDVNQKDLSLNVKCIYKSPVYYKGVKDFLSALSDEDIYGIAQTASNHKICPENIKEAVDVILLYTPDIERFFSYRRITNQLLTKYISLKGESISGHLTSYHLAKKILNIWDKLFYAEEHTQKGNDPNSENKINTNHSYEESRSLISNSQIDSTSLSKPLKEDKNRFIKSDIFAQGFCSWFYDSLNINYSGSSRLGEFPTSSIFCSNSSVDLFINPNSAPSKEIHAFNAETCADAIRDAVINLKLLFSPNLENGCQAAKSSHGLIKLFCCGSLHREEEFIGIFEQEFGLVQSPIDKNWKIFYTKVNFKTSQTDTIPSLPPCTVFEIEEHE